MTSAMHALINANIHDAYKMHDNMFAASHAFMHSGSNMKYQNES